MGYWLDWVTLCTYSSLPEVPLRRRCRRFVGSWCYVGCSGCRIAQRNSWLSTCWDEGLVLRSHQPTEKFRKNRGKEKVLGDFGNILGDFGNILGIFWEYFGNILRIFWEIWELLGIFWEILGDFIIVFILDYIISF